MATTAVGATRSGSAVKDRAYWVEAAKAAARKHGIPEDGFVAQIDKESGFQDDVIYGRRRSSAGALGIAQFMPATARGMGVDPLNPEQALDGAARLMKGQYEKYGAWGFALIAYNAGPRWADRLKAKEITFNDLPSETQNYVKDLGGIYGSERATAGIGTAIGTGGDVLDKVLPGSPVADVAGAVGKIADVLKFVTDPSMWLRIGGMILGALIMILGAYMTVKGGDAGRPIGLALASVGFVWLYGSVKAVNPADLLKSLVGAG